MFFREICAQTSLVISDVPETKQEIPDRARNRSLVIQFLLGHAASCGQSAVDELQGYFSCFKHFKKLTQNSFRSCIPLRYTAMQWELPHQWELASQVQSNTSTPQLKTRSFSSKQLRFLAANSGNCMDTSSSNAPLGIALVLLKALSHCCLSHSHNWVTTGGKGEQMRWGHIQKEKRWGRTCFKGKYKAYCRQPS